LSLRALATLLAAARSSFRGSLARRLASVAIGSALAGAAAGLLPSVVGLAVDHALDRPAGHRPGLAGLAAPALAAAPSWGLFAATVAATAIAVGASVLASRRGAAASAELTAALRIATLRAALHASPRDVEREGRSLGQSRSEGPAPPGARPPEARGIEAVKLAIAREAALAAELAMGVAAGLPLALGTLAVLTYELVCEGTWLVLAGSGALFAASRLAAERASRRVARETLAMQRADVAVFGEIGEKLAATEDLRLLGARGQAVAEVAAAAREAADARVRFAGALAVSVQIKSVFSALSPLVLLLALEASPIAHGPGEVAKLLLYVPLLLARLEALDALRIGLVERGPILAAVARLLALPESPPQRDGLRLASVVTRGALELDRVTFRPEGAAAPLLDRVSLRVPAGAVVGVCGASGSGKSTLARLVLGLDAPDEGAVRIDGVDLRDLAPEAIAEVLGSLGQSSRLLERPLRDNLTLGLAPPPTDDALREALRTARLGDLASGEAGRDLATPFRAVPPSLSGGEQRRVLLARLALRAPRVLVLDEPEAGLPAGTAETILRDVAGLAGGRTCLVITHAPELVATTFNVVLERGRIVATGTHDELAATSDVYRALLSDARAPRRA
jgi:ABC-type transport system involved in cytochrome bd biosynthesis fused ATPase/permease subunit